MNSIIKILSIIKNSNCFINRNRFFIVVGIAILGACSNPFATREAEKPTSDRSSWKQPTSPEIVIDNMRLSLIEGNETNYLNCLADNGRFRFFADEIAKSNNPGLFESWTKESEKTYINKLFTATKDSIKKADITISRVPDYGDSVLIKVEYELEFHHNLGESFPDSARGQAEFWLRALESGYVITQWTDFGAADAPSWSSIKASFWK
ncbi:hypothetical protein JW960_00360 [candidate division KSB1 bacterium]|nr:hypothetical protein [candidate division KSB1 bacterium]